MTTGTNDPLFLVGTGRCGSTIVYSCLAMHTEFAWIPSWLTEAPRFPAIAAANRFWDIPGTDRFRETRFFPKPVEPNPVFERWATTYKKQGLSPEIVEDSRKNLVPLVERLKRWQGKPRFLAKMVGRPIKVDVLASVFPDARFVHVTRALRPTASSLLLVDFYTGRDFKNWPWGHIPPTYLEFFERRGRPVELAAAVSLQVYLREIARQLDAIGASRWMTLPYADFVADPIAGTRRVAEWAGFSVTKALEERLRARNLYAGADEKWRKHFTTAQQSNLDAFEAMVAAET